ncbi:50S ribosomal protein L17 [Roseimicrobium sp. ORNL1]|uniref:50S ribosomal protein L17 n=1 Tax=Roseimicrobium sp. ORNL1 TaxID=2711231 RepID=UPI0013E101CF|nr:50S ribosomal protein L17 [Roseimicrobium sp. ORNL1]
MRHRNKTVKLQRKKPHREALLKNLCKSLIEHRRIKTTLAKAKALRPVAEKLLTLGKKNTLHSRRLAFAKLRSETLVKKLFDEIAVASADRKGGYTRITKLGQRMSDSAPMAFIEWVDYFVPAGAAAEAAPAVAEEAATEEKPAKASKSKKAAASAEATEEKPAKKASKKAAKKAESEE